MKVNNLEGVLLGMGNPLLDISVTGDEKLLEKYELEANNAILAEEKHTPLYEELINKYQVDYLAGGATQNSMRVTQWILQDPNCCSYMGCVGVDIFSKVLEEKAKLSGVNVKYQYDKEHSTGTCAVIVTQNGKCRSLVANLAAANHFKTSHLHVPENKAIVEKAKFFYISGFFLTVSPKSILEVGVHAAKENKVFSMNLSAPFICEFFSEPLMQALPYVDILFGNETEAAKFCEIQKLPGKTVRDFALEVSKLPKKNANRSRIVVFTQGDQNVIVAQDGNIEEFEVTRLTPEKLIDTNGAGDAFVGGFLAQLVQGEKIKECVRCGIWAATEIIQRPGCTFPENLTFK